MIADYPDSPDKIDGGVQAVTRYLADTLAPMDGIDLYVLSFRHGINSVARQQVGSFEHILIPYARFATLSAYATDQRILNRCLAAIEPDIVHSQGGGHQGILAKRSGYPVVTTIHGILTQEANHFEQLRRRIRTRIQGWIANYYCIRRAEHTILISPYVADFYGSTLHGESYFIPNPIDDSFFDVHRKAESNRVLFVGKLYSLKGVRDLVAAVAMCSSADKITLVLAGSLDDESYVRELEGDVHELGLDNAVEFRGILPTSELLSEFSKSTCLVLPSYQETAPMVVQEAMAAGVPVIASNICGIPHQIEHQETGYLFTPGNRHELAGLLDMVLQNEAIREEVSIAARAKANSSFRASNIAKRTLEVYQTVLREDQ